MNDLMGEQRAPTSESVKNPRWGRRILTGMIALAAIGGFGMIVVFSYDKGKENGAVAGTPVIKAQQGPTKIKPEKPGGMPIRDQDKDVYDRLDPNASKEKVENLLPPPEPAMPKPAPIKAPKITDKEVAMVTTAEPAAGAKVIAPPPAPPIVAAAKSVEKPDVSKVVAAKPIAEKKIVKPVQALKKPVKEVAALEPGYRIQLASLRSEAAALGAWRNLQKKHPSLFAGLKPDVVRAVIAGKGTYYRLQAGTLKGQAAARALCSRAKKRKIGCLIVKPR